MAVKFIMFLFVVAWLVMVGYLIYGFLPLMRLTLSAWIHGSRITRALVREVLSDEAHPAYDDMRRTVTMLRGFTVCWVAALLLWGIGFAVQHIS